MNHGTCRRVARRALHRASLVVLVAVSLGAASSCEKEPAPCPELEKDNDKTPGFELCVDLTNIPAKDHMRIRRLVNAYAARVPAADDGIQPRQDLNFIDNRAKSQVIASKGNRYLDSTDFARRGRIVATVFSSKPYEHGVSVGVSYLWVEKDAVRGWRALMIPHDTLKPISVMPMVQLNLDLHRDTSPDFGSASVMMNMPSSAWRQFMTPQVASCYNTGFGACWIHSKSLSTDAGIRNDELIDGPSDIWVFVTGQGCVCVGNKCHSSLDVSLRKEEK